LSSWQIEEVSLDKGGLHPGLKLGSDQAEEVQRLVGLLASALPDRRAFSVRAGRRFDGAVAYFLYGRLGSEGWGGLAGIGISSDD
jgi:hypothetical protein